MSKHSSHQRPLSIAALFSSSSEDRPGLAATMMVGSLCMLAFQDSLVKLISSDVSLWQYQFLRSLFNIGFLIILTKFVWGTRGLKPKSFRAVLLRSVFLGIGMSLFFGGIPFLSLSSVAAGLYVFPLFVAVMSGVVLGEKVGPRRVVAIALGFTGTVLILKPGTDAFELVGLMPIGAAFFYALTILTTRKICREESPVTLTFAVSFVFIIMGSTGLMTFSGGTFPDQAASWPYLFTGWNPIGIGILGIVLACSLLNMFATIGLAKAYQNAESSWLAPFDYSYLIFATFWGVVMWDDLPDLWSFVGMALIAGAGMYVAWRERLESQNEMKTN
jgi:drug/metabolite transporter (DMT)-like permease